MRGDMGGNLIKPPAYGLYLIFNPFLWQYMLLEHHEQIVSHRPDTEEYGISSKLAARHTLHAKPQLEFHAQASHSPPDVRPYTIHSDSFPNLCAVASRLWHRDLEHSCPVRFQFVIACQHPYISVVSSLNGSIVWFSASLVKCSPFIYTAQP